MGTLTVLKMIRERFGVAAVRVTVERGGADLRSRYLTVVLPDADTTDPDAVKRAVAGLVKARGLRFAGCDVCRGRDLAGPKVVSSPADRLGLWE